jgi:hypothetical protein
VTRTLSHELAAFLLYGLNLSCDEVTATHLRCFDEQYGPLEEVEVWEVEVETSFGIAISLRSTCPLDAASAVAERIVEMLAAQRARMAVN